MRITNNMITGNTKTNINSNKVNVDTYNTQMTTQKKIAKASDDPVIAIRSLRLGTSLSHINQYVDNNIPDASAWLDVTFTSLNNMYKLVSDIRTQCVNGSTDTLTAADRKTILQSLQAMSGQIYTEGNADYAGRTVFTGYRTNHNLTFDTDSEDTKYQINQPLDYNDMEEKRYYSGDVVVPDNADTTCTVDISQDTYMHLRMAYDQIDSVDGMKYTDRDGNVVNYVFAAPGETADLESDKTDPETGLKTSYKAAVIYENEQEWEKASTSTPPKKDIGDDEVIFIQETGEFIFGKDIAAEMRSQHAQFDITYTKTGFDAGELRPEYYYDCTDKTDANPDNWVEYTKEDQDINYTIANATTLTVNTQASDVFDSSIARDMGEMINIVQDAINAHDKVDKIKEMMAEAQYADPASQERLQTYLDAAKKEADYADDHLQRTYEAYIGKFDKYMSSINVAITNVGSMQNRLKMTQTRVESQQSTIEELKSSNEDREISDIIIDYYAAYNAYQASLTAASKVGDQTLLNYL